MVSWHDFQGVFFPNKKRKESIELAREGFGLARKLKVKMERF